MLVDGRNSISSRFSHNKIAPLPYDDSGLLPSISAPPAFCPVICNSMSTLALECWAQSVVTVKVRSF